MDDGETLRINPNTADAEALKRLPGVGPALAERILAARPFQAPQDMLRVPGVTEATLERLAPHLVFEPPPSSDTEQIRPAPAAPAGAAAPLPQAPFSRRQAFALAGAAALASALLSVLLTLLILAGINGSLSVASNRTVRQLGTDLLALQRTVAGAESQLASVENRLAALEGLSGRMASVEAEARALRMEVDSARGQVQAMAQSLRRLSEANDALARRADAYDAFFAGLHTLLGPLVPAPTPTPEGGLP